MSFRDRVRRHISFAAGVHYTYWQRHALVFSFKDPDLGRFIALGRNANVEAIALGVPVAGANANRGRHVGDQLIVVGILLLDHADDAFTADNVDAFAGSVEVNVVALARRAQPRHFVTGLRVENDEHRRL